MLLCAQGETILKTLAALSGKLSVRIAVNKPQASQPQDDLRLLNDSGDAPSLDFIPASVKMMKKLSDVWVESDVTLSPSLQSFVFTHTG